MSMTIDEARENKRKFKELIKNEQNPDKVKEYRRKIYLLDSHIGKILTENPDLKQQRGISIEEFVYYNHKKLGYSVGTISKHTHKSQVTISKIISEYKKNKLAKAMSKLNEDDIESYLKSKGVLND